MRVLTECIQSNYSLIQENFESKNGKRMLGTLKGVCAECDASTRNDRIYTRSLWEKTLNSSWVKEGLQNLVIYGELGHPEDRLDIDIEKIAICFTGFEIQPDGKIIGTFDILDTPMGQLLKSLVDYGSILGISTRGGGDTYIREGRTYVKEDDYQFVTFDIVLMPGVQTARLNITEGVELDTPDVKSLYENITSVINDTKDTFILKNLKNILEQIEVSDKEKLISTIDEKISSSEGETIPPTVLEDLQKLQDSVASLEEQLDQSRKACQAETIRREKLEEKFGKLASSIKLKTANDNNVVSILKESASVANTKTTELNEELTSIKNERDSLKRRLDKQSTVESVLRKGSDSLQESVTNLQAELSTTKASLLESNSKVEKLNSKLTEERQLREKEVTTVQKDTSIQLKKLQSQLTESERKLSTAETERRKAVKMYVEQMCSIYGLPTQQILKITEGKSMTSVAKYISESVDNNIRLSDLPFSVNSESSFKGLNEEVKVEETPMDYGTQLLYSLNKNNYKGN